MQNLQLYYPKIVLETLSKELTDLPEEDLIALDVARYTADAHARHYIPPLGRGITSDDVSIEVQPGTKIERDLLVRIRTDHPSVERYFALQPSTFYEEPAPLRYGADGVVSFDSASPGEIERTVEEIRRNCTLRDAEILARSESLKDQMTALVERAQNQANARRETYRDKLDALPFEVHDAGKDDEEATPEAEDSPLPELRLIPDQEQNDEALGILQELTDRVHTDVDAHREELGEAGVGFLEDAVLPGLDELKTILSAQVSATGELDALRSNGRMVFRLAGGSLRAAFHLGGALGWGAGILGDGPQALENLERIGKAAGIS